MKEIYLVQKMERDEFKQCARKGVKVKNLEVYGQVVTMWCESKINAIDDCREKNHEQQYEVFFVRKIVSFLK